MKRRIEGLREATQTGRDEVPDGVFLARVERVQYRWHPQKPFYALRLSVLEPREFGGRTISGRLYCTAKALWKLSWFLRDFGYDTDLLGRDEVDERALIGLRGVVKISHTTINGTHVVNLDGFARASQWEELAGDGRQSEHDRGGGEGTDGARNRAVGDHLLQAVQEPDSCH